MVASSISTAGFIIGTTPTNILPPQTWRLMELPAGKELLEAIVNAPEGKAMEILELYRLKLQQGRIAALEKENSDAISTGAEEKNAEIRNSEDDWMEGAEREDTAMDEGGEESQEIESRKRASSASPADAPEKKKSASTSSTRLSTVASRIPILKTSIPYASSLPKPGLSSKYHSINIPLPKNYATFEHKLAYYSLKALKENWKFLGEEFFDLIIVVVADSNSLIELTDAQLDLRWRKDGVLGWSRAGYSRSRVMILLRDERVEKELEKIEDIKRLVCDRLRSPDRGFFMTKCIFPGVLEGIVADYLRVKEDY